MNGACATQSCAMIYQFEALGDADLVHHVMCGELSKREGVLFHWWLFSSKRNDELQLFYTDISLI